MLHVDGITFNSKPEILAMVRGRHRLRREQRRVACGVEAEAETEYERTEERKGEKERQDREKSVEVVPLIGCGTW